MDDRPLPRAHANGELPSSTESVSGAEGRIRGFDGLRAIAFLLVFTNHKALSPFTDRLGASGVWLFLVLSGFLMVRILRRSRTAVENQGGGVWRALAVFYLRRSARIFPAYYVFIVAAIGLGAVGYTNVMPPKEVVAELLFLSNLYIERVGWHNELGHLWTLAVEQQFYLVFAPLALLVPSRSTATLCASVVVLSLVAFAVYRRLGVWIYPSTLVNIGAMAFGGWVGLQARPLPAVLRTSPAMLAAACLAMAPALLVSDEDSFILLGRLSMLPMALLLVQIVQAQGSALVGALEWRPLRWIGSVSYCAYLVHPLVHLEGIAALLGHEGVALPHGLNRLGELAITLAISAASAVLIERPALHAGRRWAARIAAAERPAAATALHRSSPT